MRAGQCIKMANFVILNIAHFITSSAVVFVVKMVLNRNPYPITLSLFRTIMAMFLMLVSAWVTKGCQRNLKFIIPPAPMLGVVVKGGIAYCALTTVSNLSLFVSSVDFVTIFRMTGLVWNSLVGYFILHERVNTKSAMALAIIVIGMILSMSDFQWTTALMSAKWQMIIMILSMLLETVNSMFYKQAYEVMGRSPSDFTIYSFNFWEYAISIIPMTMLVYYKHETNSQQLASITTPNFLGMLFLVTILGQVAAMLYIKLHDGTSLISLGVIAQLKILLKLVASHLIFGDTTWNAKQVIATGLLFIGGIIYVIPTSKKAEEPPDERALLVIEDDDE